MENKIREQILRWLTRRDHSKQEIILKLKQKNLPIEIAQPIIASMMANELINEQRYAESYIRSRQSKGYGPVRISLELKAKGIAEDIIAEALDIADNAWLVEIKKVWQKYCKGKPPKDYSARAKQMRFLQQRGFTQEQIKYIICDHYDEI